MSLTHLSSLIPQTIAHETCLDKHVARYCLWLTLPFTKVKACDMSDFQELSCYRCHYKSCSGAAGGICNNVCLKPFWHIPNGKSTFILIDPQNDFIFHKGDATAMSNIDEDDDDDLEEEE